MLAIHTSTDLEPSFLSLNVYTHGEETLSTVTSLLNISAHMHYFMYVHVHVYLLLNLQQIIHMYTYAHNQRVGRLSM